MAAEPQLDEPEAPNDETTGGDRSIDPRRYVAVDPAVAFSRHGTRLLTEFGNEGLLAWMLLIAWAKREWPQGKVSFCTDQEAWAKLGMAEPAGFTLDEFLGFCGRARQTRRYRHGRITYVELAHWHHWNKPPRSRTSRNEAKRGQTRPDLTKRDETSRSEAGRTPAQTSLLHRCEGEGEEDLRSRQGEEDLVQVPTGARARDPVSSPPDLDQPDGQGLDGVLSRVASRRAAIRHAHGSIAPLLEVIADTDLAENTPQVLHQVFDPLGEDAVRLAARELLEAGPRLRGSAAAYAVAIGKRLARDRDRNMEALVERYAADRDVGLLGYA